MKILYPPKSTPAWQIERARKIHAACRWIQRGLDAGETFERMTRIVSRRYDGKPFKSEPSKTMALRQGTLICQFYRWKHGGEVTAALGLNYRKRPPYVAAPVLVRFVKFCSERRLTSLRDAWARFMAHGQNPRGKHRYSYGQICYHFPASRFYLLQGCLKQIADGEALLRETKFKLITEITDRLPSIAPRRKEKPAPNFEI